MLSNPRHNHPKKNKIPTWFLWLSAGFLFSIVILLGTPWAARFFVGLFLAPAPNSTAPTIKQTDKLEITAPQPAPSEPLPDNNLSPLLQPLIQALANQDQNVNPQPEPITPTESEVKTDYLLNFVLPQFDGSIQHVQVKRKLVRGPSPVKTVIEALLEGPTAEELKQNILSLIPSNTRLLSLQQSGEVVTINFSDDFQLNSLGADGYKAQIVQVLQTLSQFPSVKKVQFLIEGQRVQTLGEIIPLNFPLEIQRFQ